MKQRDTIKLVAVAIVAGLFSLIISNMIFSSAQKPTAVPDIEKISSDFPQVKNDSNYTTFFNNNAIDPTQLIQIGNTQNSTPFNTPQ